MSEDHPSETTKGPASDEAAPLRPPPEPDYEEVAWLQLLFQSRYDLCRYQWHADNGSGADELRLEGLCFCLQAWANRAAYRGSNPRLVECLAKSQRVAINWLFTEAFGRPASEAELERLDEVQSFEHASTAGLERFTSPRSPASAGTD